MGNINDCTSQQQNIYPVVGETIDIAMSCGIVIGPPAAHNMNSYNLQIFTTQNTFDSYTFLVTVDYKPPQQVSVNASVIGGGPLPLGVILSNATTLNEAFRTIIIPTINQNADILTITIKPPGELFSLVYDIIFAADSFRRIYIQRVNLNEQGQSGLGLIPSSPAGPNAVPNLTGRIFLTNDGQEICQLDYIAVTAEEIRTYVQYCMKAAPLLRGEGCTLAEKVRSLQKEGLAVDFITMVTYISLRLILSQLLGICPFTRFDVHFLKRKYYAEFLRTLGESQWRAFLAYFTDPVYRVVNYWKYFH